jgi:uncharacterized protein (TIGR00297 family)
MNSDYIIIISILTLGAALSVFTNKLTFTAAFTGWLVGLMVFIGAGYGGVFMLATFFILGTTATSVGIKFKENLGIAEARKGRRTGGQVIANAGVAALCGILVLVFPNHSGLLQLAIAGSLASATADTVSSELGNVYGSNYYNIITFKKDTKGLDGVVSLEGTLAGIVGSIIIGFVYYLFFKDMQHGVWIILAGATGNLADSVLGATIERKKFIGNNAVNFLNTLTGALVAIVCHLLSQ